MYGLGVTYNIARTAPSQRDIARIFGSPTTTLGPSYVPPKTTTTTAPRTTTSIPKTTTTTATATNPKAQAATVTPPKTPTFLPPSVSSVATARPMASDGTPLTVSMDPAEALTDSGHSPLWLILAGLGALLLLENRKKGRR